MPARGSRTKETKKVVKRDGGVAWGTLLERHQRTIAIFAVLLASARIIATYTVFNHTFDEPAHIACGMEWLADGKYTWEAQHPPLARVAAAIGPYLLGTRSQKTPRVKFFSMTEEGIAILLAGHNYDLSLALARLGELPFFWIACLVIYQWGRRYFDWRVALAALFIFSFLPPVLAHAGLATTDMALTAMAGAAFLRGVIWLEDPSIPNTIWFGVAGAFGALSKFTFTLYFPAVAILGLACYFALVRPGFGDVVSSLKMRLPMLGLAILIALPIVWAAYRFSFGSPAGHTFRMPAPEVYEGIAQVIEHNKEGHPAYLLGQRSQKGFLLFYPVGLVTKTPIAVLLLFGVGCYFVFRSRRTAPHGVYAFAFFAGILLPALASRINIGIRHILPIYFGIALVSAIGMVRLLELGAIRKSFNLAVGALAMWLAVASLLSHPDYLPYFNEFAGSQPEKILVDSDLDWGQDVKRLASRLRDAGARSMTYPTLMVGDLESYFGIPKRHRSMDALNPPPGWAAVEVTYWKAFRFGLMERYANLPTWPDRFPPIERVGKSILLYRFPGEAQ